MSACSCAIRPVRRADPVAIEALYRACMDVELGIGPVTATGWSQTVSLPQFYSGRDFLVAEQDGCVVGLAESSPRGHEAHRVRHLKLIVDPAYRRRGIATALFRVALGQDGDERPVMLQANVPARWAAGVAFLDRYGFVLIESEITLRCEAPFPLLAKPADVEVMRPATTDDIAARLAAIHNASFHDDAGFAWQTPADAMRHVEAGHLWVARLASQVVGYALVDSDPDLGWLETVAVDPAHRGRGIGAALVVRALLADGVGPGRAAGLSVSSTNGAARRLYERLGFRYRTETGKYAAARADLLTRLPAAP